LSANASLLQQVGSPQKINFFYDEMKKNELIRIVFFLSRQVFFAETCASAVQKIGKNPRGPEGPKHCQSVSGQDISTTKRMFLPRHQQGLPIHLGQSTHQFLRCDAMSVRFRTVSLLLVKWAVWEV